MTNLHLFELINAAPGLSHLQVAMAVALAQWAIYGIPLMMAVAWARGDDAARRELLQIVLAASIALGFAQLVSHVWPQPRPFAIHLGTQYLAHGNDPGLPSDHVTAIWSVALIALNTRQFALWTFPLLALGLLVGWSRVYLGVHFPFDILAALPVALAGTLAAMALRVPLSPVLGRILNAYDRLTGVLRAKFHPSRKS